MARLPISDERRRETKNAAGRGERQETVEQRFGVAAEQVLVMRLADAEVERVETAPAASARPD